MSPCSIFAVIVCLLLFTTRGQCQEGILRIQLLVPFESENNRIYHTESTIPAAMMAVDDINDNPDYLLGYKLVLDVSDTQCDQSEGTWQMIDSVLKTSDPNISNIIAFIGGSCSIVTEPTAALSGRLYKVVQIAYDSASPILSDRSMYPLFYRTYPSENIFNDVYFALIKKYNWCISATLHQTVNLFSLSVTDFHMRFEQQFLNTSKTGACQSDNDKPILFSFTGDPEIPLRQIQTKDVRIIFGYFYEDLAIVVMCYAKNMGLTADKYLWVLPGWYTTDWWKLADRTDWSRYKYNCTSDDIKEAIDYSLLVDYYAYPLNESVKSLSGYTTAQFTDKYNQYLDTYLNDNNKTSLAVAYQTLTYDALWALAIALNKTENDINQDFIFLDDFQYSQAAPDQDGIVVSNTDDTINNYITYNISKYLKETNFSGVSGEVNFDENGDPSGPSIIFQYRIANNGSMLKNRLGLYNSVTDGLNITFENKPEWKTGNPPTDRRTPENKTTSPLVVVFINVFVGLGIALCLFLLIFNTVTIWKPLIKNSAPLMNTVIIIGCLLLFCACILMGIDSNNPKVVDGELNLRDVPKTAIERYEIVCTVRLWLLTIGFTLSFGALFAKTWQVYRVYTNPKLKEQALKIWNFLIILAIQLVLDVLFLSIWTGLYRFRRAIDEKTSGNILFIYEYCDCDNFSYLIGALYVYKGLLAIFGLFLAYESRNVKYFYINDSRFISISMYIVIILIGIGAPLSLVLAGERFIDPAYCVAVCMIILACSSCLLILYVPKFYYMFKGADTMIPKAKLETFTPVDKLQLGRTDVNSEDLQNIDKELKELKEQVELVEQTKQINELRRGSDQDSGVHCDNTDNSLSVVNGYSNETNLSSFESGPREVIVEEDESDDNKQITNEQISEC